MDKEATLQRLTAFNAQLEAEAQQAKDAARYRFLRTNHGANLMLDHFCPAGPSLDRLIDAAIANS